MYTGKVCSSNIARKKKKRLSANHQTPVDHRQKLSFEDIEFRDRYAAHFCVEIIWTKDITEAFTGYSYRGDDKSMTGQRREGEKRHSSTDLVDVEKNDEQTCFLV